MPGATDVAHGHRLESLGFVVDHRPHSSSILIRALSLGDLTKEQIEQLHD